MLVDYINKMKIYMIGAVLGSLTGAMLYGVQPERWEIQAMVRLGNNTEAQLVAIERMRSHGFLQAVGKKLNNKDAENLINRNNGRIKIKPIRNTDHIIIELTANDPDIPPIIINSMIEELIFKHKEISDVQRALLQDKLLTYNNNLMEMKSKMGLFSQRALVQDGSLSVLLRQMSEITEKIMDVSNTIAVIDSYPTRLVEKLAVERKFIFTSPWQAILIGLLFGIATCFFWTKLRKN